MGSAIEGAKSTDGSSAEAAAKFQQSFRRRIAVIVLENGMVFMGSGHSVIGKVSDSSTASLCGKHVWMPCQPGFAMRLRSLFVPIHVVVDQFSGVFRGPPPGV